MGTVNDADDEQDVSQSLEHRSAEMLMTLKTGRVPVARAMSNLNMPMPITEIKKKDARKALT